MNDLEGQVALVTGATGGFGSRFVEVLASHGAAVMMTGRRVDRLRELAAKLGDLYSVAYHAADITADPVALFERAEGEYGPVTILVNNAGVGHADRALDCEPVTWDRVIATDLTAPFAVAQEAARRMVKYGLPGTIINVASIYGLRPAKAMIAYASAKAALIQVTRALAAELGGKGIRVNALAPGWCVTDLTRSYLQTERGGAIARDIPLGRFGAPDDLDGPLLLLASDAGRYIHGVTLTVDGGLSAVMRG